MKLKLFKTKPGNLPYVPLYHGTSKYNFIVDTGATLNWILPKVLACFLQEGEIRSTQKTVNGTRYRALSATLRTVPRTYTDDDDVADKLQAVFCSGAMENIEAMNAVLESDNIHGILGMEFLTGNHAVVDIKNLTMKV